MADKLRRSERGSRIARHLQAQPTETATLYELTALGRSLVEPLPAFDRWVAANCGQVEAVRRDRDRRARRS